jgi:hypothetical protein
MKPVCDEARTRTMLCRILLLVLVPILVSCRSHAPTPDPVRAGPVRELFPSQVIEVPPPAPAVAQPAGAATPRIKAPKDSAAPLVTAWPLSLSADDATFVVHEPLVETLDDGVMTARSLVLAQPAGPDRPVAGSVLMKAIAEVDAAAGVVSLVDVEVLDASFPTTPDRIEAWQQFLRSSLPGKVKTMQLTRFESGRSIAQARQRASAASTVTAPRIIVSQAPAVLVYIDGEPRYAPLRGTSLQGVVNTRVLLLKDESGTSYLHVYDGWVSAASLQGPWQLTPAPAGAERLEQLARSVPQVDLLTGKADANGRLPALSNARLPQIFVSMQPAALIVLDGPPRFARIGRTALQYATNTTAHLFRDVASNGLYVRVGGNWFRASDVNGPWTHVPAASLPASFAAIPDGSPKRGVKTSIDNELASTAPRAGASSIVSADPRTATLSVTVNGDPVLEPIPNTQLNYVANASVPIIQVDINNWYATQSGVWFHSNEATGPWEVTSNVPPEIYAIPRNTPIYHAIQSRAIASSTDVTYYGYPTAGSLRSEGGAIGIEDQGADYQYTPPSSLHWNWVYR